MRRPLLDALQAPFAGRAVWSLVDQALSSTTNFAITILIARSFSSESLGGFALAYAFYTALLQLSRCFSSEPLIVRFSSSERDAWHAATMRAASTALSLGFLGAGAGLAVASVTTGALRDSFLVVGIFLPLLLLQDLWRFSFFTLGRPRSAALNDGVWVVAMTVLLTAVYLFSAPTLVSLVFVWALSGGIAGVFGVLQVRARPRVTHSRAWIAAHRDLSVRFAGEFLVYSAAIQATLYIVGAVAGVAAVGSIRAAQTLVGPVALVYLGVSFGAVPEGVRIASAAPDRLRTFVGRLSVCLAGVGVIWAAVVLALPESVGRAILGDTWPSARHLLPLIVVAIVAEGLNVGPWVGLRALAAAGRSLRGRAIIAAVTVAAGTVGAATHGAWGAAAGLAIGSVVGTGVWTWELIAAQGSRPSRPSVEATIPGAS
jgi:O-antigen/teichoic acid export membrane protein